MTVILSANVIIMAKYTVITIHSAPKIEGKIDLFCSQAETLSEYEMDYHFSVFTFVHMSFTCFAKKWEEARPSVGFDSLAFFHVSILGALAALTIFQYPVAHLIFPKKYRRKRRRIQYCKSLRWSSGLVILMSFVVCTQKFHDCGVRRHPDHAVFRSKKRIIHSNPLLYVDCRV